MTESEKLFLEKYGNKITASESWVIRFADDFAAQESERVNARLQELFDKLNKSCHYKVLEIADLQNKLSSVEQALETETIGFYAWVIGTGRKKYGDKWVKLGRFDKTDKQMFYEYKNRNK